LAADFERVTVAWSVAVGLGGGRRREHCATDAIPVKYQTGISESIGLFQLVPSSKNCPKIEM
jgi:hypothetical protein